MAFLRETQRSLRLYLLFAGGISILISLSQIGEASTLSGLPVPASWAIAIWVPLLSRLGLGAGFIAAGIKLESALLAGAGWIKKLLIASVLITAFDIILVTAILGADIAKDETTRGVIGLAITVYLLHNVTRLSKEAKDRHGVPPEPPQARVVS